MNHIALVIPALLGFSLTVAAQEPQITTEAPAAATVEKTKKVAKSTSAEDTYKFDLSTNLFDWADLGTVNVDFGYALSRHFSLQAGAKFNGWQFKPKDSEFELVENKQLSFSLGARYWPWYVFSGWWVAAKVQYADYEETGIWRQAYDIGKALGAGISAGYTMMITERFNIEAGFGFWGGKLLEHELYHCPGRCYELGDLRESGPKGFIALNDINISFHFLF